MKPLVSILIPAYNAEKWIADTLRSAIAQTWPHREIIVVDDGSSDGTLDVARQFEADGVRVIGKKNEGAAATRNAAYRLSKGDYVQWLDADDLLAPDKIEKQLAALGERESRRILLSSPWAPFYFRTRNARFIDSALCRDLSPLEWLLAKMEKNLYMQTATWLTSRELAEAAGPWNTRLLSDDDSEYYCRVLLQSEGTRFVSGTGTFYRITTGRRLSQVDDDRKKNALLVSMKLHVQYIRSLEDSERVRQACLNYFKTWYLNFYPERPDLVAQLNTLAADLGGQLREPQLRWKYAWMKPLFGWQAAKMIQAGLLQLKTVCNSHCDNLMYWLEGRAN